MCSSSRLSSHTAAHEAENYKRLEFVGDCILKYYISIQSVAEHPERLADVVESLIGAASIDGGLAKGASMH
jgi:dsRNA-specific ribonuclease